MQTALSTVLLTLTIEQSVSSMAAFLGKQYSAKGILDRCSEIQSLPAHKDDTLDRSSLKSTLEDKQKQMSETSINEHNKDLLENLLQPEYTSDYVPNQLTKKREKEKEKTFYKTSITSKDHSYANRRKRTVAKENTGYDQVN